MASTEDNVLLNQIVNQGINIYGSREKIRNQLVQFAQQYLDLGNMDIQKTSYLAYLIDILSILSANQLFYDSTIYKEFFMVDAQMSESVQNLASWIGYTVPKASPASVNILFTIPLTFSVSQVNFNFPKYFKCKAGEIPFTIEGSYNSNDSATNVSMNLLKLKNIYGTSPTNSGNIINNSILTVRDYNGYYRPVYLSSDRKSCAFSLPFKQEEVIVQSYMIPDTLGLNQFYNITVEYTGQVSEIEVWLCSPSYGQKLNTAGSAVDGILDPATWDPNSTIIDTAGQKCSFVKWAESTNGVYTMSARAEQYTWVGSYDKGQIFFGNGIVGKQPTPGSVCVVQLHVTQGSSGNVISNTIISGDPLYLDIGAGRTSNINYSCLNYEASVGGKDILSTAEIKQNAIVNLSSKERLVSDNDYDNIQTIIGNSIPLSDCVPILKRSDIKVNEIMVFTLLNYTANGVNEIVPTRNVTIDLINPQWDENNQYVIPRNYEVTVGPEDYRLTFLTVFNMVLDKNTKTAYYDYILQKADGVTTTMYIEKVKKWNQQTYMSSTGTSFQIDLDKKTTLSPSYPLVITFNINHIASEIYEVLGVDDPNNPDMSFTDVDHVWGLEEYIYYFQIINFRCKMTTKWGNFAVYDSNSNNDVIDETGPEVKKIDGVDVKALTRTYKSFSFTLGDYTMVPNGKQRFEFRIECLAPELDSEGNVLGYIEDDLGNVIRENVILVLSDGTVNPQLTRDQISNAYVNMLWQDLSNYYCDVTVRKDMSDCMQSSITVDSYVNGINAGYGENIYHVHNVPTIYQEYYHDVVGRTSDQSGTSNFEMVVMQKLIDNLNFDNLKMLTDFINIKFADTYGILNNLKYNPPSYNVESRYTHTPWWVNAQDKQGFPDGAIENPDYEEPSSIASDVYYVVNGKIDGNYDPLNQYIGYIARRDVTVIYDDDQTDVGVPEYTYQLIQPTLGMVIKVKDELDSSGDIQTCIWNGRIWKTVDDYTIPLKLKIKVEVDETVTGKSDKAIQESVIQTLSEYFQDKMGLQENLDRSDIVRVCRSVDGVVYAELQDPEFDIRFNYEVSDLTQKELLDFTPQYVGFRGISTTNNSYDSTTIDVEVVRK